MTDFKDKGNKSWRLSMKKLGDRLPWLMEAELPNLRTWRIYIDSRIGDAFRNTLIGPKDQEKITLAYSNSKEVSEEGTQSLRRGSGDSMHTREAQQ